MSAANAGLNESSHCRSGNHEEQGNEHHQKAERHTKPRKTADATTAARHGFRNYEGASAAYGKDGYQRRADDH